MKKKYSILLKFALAVTMATALVACSESDDFTGSTGGAAFCVGGLHPPMKFEAVDNMPILRSLQDPHVVGVH